MNLVEHGKIKKLSFDRKCSHGYRAKLKTRMPQISHLILLAASYRRILNKEEETSNETITVVTR